MLAVLLMIAVAAGIAWPYVHNRFFATREFAPATDTDDDHIFSHTAPQEREELCAACSTLNPPHRRLCVECGAAMPVEGVSNLFAGSNKEELMRESLQSGLLFVAMIIAMVLANFLPVGGKVVILLLTIAALGYRVLSVIQD